MQPLTYLCRLIRAEKLFSAVKSKKIKVKTTTLSMKLTTNMQTRNWNQVPTCAVIRFFGIAEDKGAGKDIRAFSSETCLVKR